MSFSAPWPGGTPTLFSCLYQEWSKRDDSLCPGLSVCCLILGLGYGSRSKRALLGQQGPVQKAQPKPSLWGEWGGSALVREARALAGSGRFALPVQWGCRHLLSLPPPPPNPLQLSLHSCPGLTRPVPGLPSNKKECVLGGGRGGGWTPLGKGTVPRLRPGWNLLKADNTAREVT